MHRSWRSGRSRSPTAPRQPEAGFGSPVPVALSIGVPRLTGDHSGGGTCNPESYRRALIVVAMPIVAAVIVGIAIVAVPAVIIRHAGSGSGQAVNTPVIGWAAAIRC